MPPYTPIEFRLVEKIELTNEGCWLWTGALDRLGYAQLNVAGRKVGGHRVAYELMVGRVPEGLELDHICRQRRCVNPTHLDPVTHRENVLRGMGVTAANATKTHCPKGHAYDAKNTYVGPDGRRGCRACNRAAARRYSARKNHERHPA